MDPLFVESVNALPISDEAKAKMLQQHQDALDAAARAAVDAAAAKTPKATKRVVLKDSDRVWRAGIVIGYRKSPSQKGYDKYAIDVLGDDGKTVVDRVCWQVYSDNARNDVPAPCKTGQRVTVSYGQRASGGTFNLDIVDKTTGVASQVKYPVVNDCDAWIKRPKS
jgi:hypothetical protein